VNDSYETQFQTLAYDLAVQIFRIKDAPPAQKVSRKKMKSFAGLLNKSSAITENCTEIEPVIKLVLQL
jgi:hypothetical protein